MPGWLSRELRFTRQWAGTLTAGGGALEGVAEGLAEPSVADALHVRVDVEQGAVAPLGLGRDELLEAEASALRQGVGRLGCRRY
jgi:hypothetical protein